MFCDHCGHPISENNKFCKNCGKPVNTSAPVVPEPPKPENNCPYCGTPFEEGEVFCSHCGNKLKSEPVVVQPQAADFAVPVQEPVIQHVQPAPVQKPVAQPQYVQPAPMQQSVMQQPMQKPVYQKKAKMSKGKLAVLIAIPILILAIGVGAWFFLTEQKKQDAYNTAVELLEDQKYDQAQDEFLALGDYKDAAAQAQAIQEKKDAYQEAQTLLDENCFDEALALFASLGDYRDAKSYTPESIAYQKACYVLECAHSGQKDGLRAMGIDPKGEYADGLVEEILYNSALEIFTNLDTYQNAQDYALDCEMGLLTLYRTNGNLDAYQKKLNTLFEEEKISPELYDELFYLYFEENAEAEQIFRDNLIASLREYMEMEESGEYSAADFVDMQLGYLVELGEYTFEDSYLEQLYYRYMEYLYGHYDAMDSSEEYIEDYALWYYIRYETCALLEVLQDQYNFFEESPSVFLHFMERKERYLAYATLEEEMERQLVGVAAVYSEEADAYYLTFVNDTEYEFDLYLLLEFHDGNTYISDSGWYEIHIPQGQIVSLPILFDLGNDWDTWYINWDYENIYLDGEKID